MTVLEILEWLNSLGWITIAGGAVLGVIVATVWCEIENFIKLRRSIIDRERREELHKKRFAEREDRAAAEFGCAVLYNAQTDLFIPVKRQKNK